MSAVGFNFKRFDVTCGARGGLWRFENLRYRRGVRGRWPAHRLPEDRARRDSVHLPETFLSCAHWYRRPYQGSSTMKQILPIMLSLIPLAAVVGACVAVP
jgi:hypothetical protein